MIGKDNHVLGAELANGTFSGDKNLVRGMLNARKKKSDETRNGGKRKFVVKRRGGDMRNNGEGRKRNGDKRMQNEPAGRRR